MSSTYYQFDPPRSLTLRVRVKPGARRAPTVTNAGDHLEVSLQARPVEGAANAELFDLLAKHFDCRRTDISMVSGQRSRDKVVRVELRRDHTVDELDAL